MFKCKNRLIPFFCKMERKNNAATKNCFKNHSAGEGTKALARPPIAGGVGRSDRVGNRTTRIRQEFPESDDYFDYLQVLQYYPRRIFRTAQLPAERQINTSGVSAAGIRRDEPDKRQTDNRKTDKQQARTGGNNRQQTTYKKVPQKRNLLHTAIRRLTPPLRQRRGTARRLRAWSS